MYKFLVDNGQRLAFGVGIGVTALFLIVSLSGMDSFSMLPEEEQFTTGIFDVGIKGALVLVVLAAISMVGFGLTQILGNFKGSLIGILGFGALLAIFFVSFSMSPGEATGAIAESIERTGSDISASNLKFIGGAISTAVSLVLVAAASFVIFEIRNFFK
jgi:hypothetical protein